MMDVRCPACDANEADAAPAASQRTCARCGLVFAEDRRDPGPGWYRESGLYAGDGPDDEHVEGALDGRHALFFERVTPGRVLDVGCGVGVFLRRARSRGFEVRGVEQQAAQVRRARKAELEVHTSTLEEYGEDSGFDAVTSFDVLEHLADPLDAARRLLALARPGGTVVVSVPRADRNPPVFDPVIDAPPHHFTLWTEAALRALLERAGGSEVEVVALPLHPRDLFLHHIWRRHGHGPALHDHWDSLVLLGLRVKVLGLKLLGRARGHTLVAFARRT